MSFVHFVDRNYSGLIIKEKNSLLGSPDAASGIEPVNSDAMQIHVPALRLFHNNLIDEYPREPTLGRVPGWQGDRAFDVES